MSFLDIYSLGKYIPGIEIAKEQEKLTFVQFPYSIKEVTSTCILIYISFQILALLLWPLTPFFLYAGTFLGLILAISLYIYPTSIYYTQQIIDYREEMLRAILKMSTYISMNTSLEYAMKETIKDIKGTLKLQYQDIFRKLKAKEVTTLGDAIETYVPVWNDINPEFVKALKLLQTAALSPKEEQEEILKEILETIIQAYHSQGKRFAEELANNAKTLIAVGVLLPIITLMLLPLVSIFMPKLVQPPVIAFVYNVFFPVSLLVMALKFSSSRVQVNTIRIEESPQYQKPPVWLYVIAFCIVGVLAVPTIAHLNSINLTLIDTAAREYQLESVAVCWMLGLGITLAIFGYSWFYTRRYKKLWTDVYETEQDFPYLLQIFSTYLNLNRSVESVIPEIIDDYKTHGFKDHPVVKIFTSVKTRLTTTKQTINEITKKVLPQLCPSRKVASSLNQIIAFTNVSQKSAGKAAKMIRKQSLSIFELDDYIRSLLADTVALINVTTTMLAPLLSAAAVIMALAIVMSLRFITEQLEIIQNSLGVVRGSSLQLVDITKIVPPTIIEVVVSIYLIELILVLSIFASNIKIGNDRYQMLKNIGSNMIGFSIYTVILFGGFVMFKQVIFAGVIS